MIAIIDRCLIDSIKNHTALTTYYIYTPASCTNCYPTAVLPSNTYCIYTTSTSTLTSTATSTTTSATTSAATSTTTSTTTSAATSITTSVIYPTTIYPTTIYPTAAIRLKSRRNSPIQQGSCYSGKDIHK